MKPTLLTNDTRTPPQAKILSGAIFVLGVAIIAWIAKPWRQADIVLNFWVWGPYVGVFILSWIVRHSLKVAEQWERAVILRFGAYRGLSGPGFFFIIPILEYISRKGS